MTHLTHPMGFHRFSMDFPNFLDLHMAATPGPGRPVPFLSVSEAIAPPRRGSGHSTWSRIDKTLALQKTSWNRWFFWLRFMDFKLTQDDSWPSHPICTSSMIVFESVWSPKKSTLEHSSTNSLNNKHTMCNTHTHTYIYIGFKRTLRSLPHSQVQTYHLW